MRPAQAPRAVPPGNLPVLHRPISRCCQQNRERSVEFTATLGVFVTSFRCISDRKKAVVLTLAVLIRSLVQASSMTKIEGKEALGPDQLLPPALGTVKGYRPTERSSRHLSQKRGQVELWHIASAYSDCPNQRESHSRRSRVLLLLPLLQPVLTGEWSAINPLGRAVNRAWLKSAARSLRQLNCDCACIYTSCPASRNSLLSALVRSA
jgi:hypothetical protein